MIWRTAFVVVLLTVLAVACTPRHRVDCEEPIRYKNKSLGITGTTRYGDAPPLALSC